MEKDYYKILEVEKNASKKEIKNSYRKLSKKYHPDLNPDNEKAEEKFKEIANAYSVLSDDTKRINYDKFGNENGNTTHNPFNHMNYEDIFSTFFNERNNNLRKKKGGDIRLKIELTLEEIFTGVNKTIKYKKRDKCNSCSGTGGETKVCDNCKGNGFLVFVQNTPMGRIQKNVKCNVCNGEKNIITNPCKKCDSSGTLVNETIFNFELPKGIMDSEMLKFNGKGNSVKNGVEGDLIVLIVEKTHDTFKRVGIDLHQRINFTYEDLVNGNDSVEVVTIDGKIRFKVKKGTQIGTILRIPKKGLKKGDNIGDMLLEVWLKIPENITKKEKKEKNEIN